MYDTIDFKVADKKTRELWGLSAKLGKLNLSLDFEVIYMFFKYAPFLYLQENNNIFFKTRQEFYLYNTQKKDIKKDNTTYVRYKKPRK